jgi:hypothetical protein
MGTETLLAFGSLIFALVAGWFIYAGLSVDVTIATEVGLVTNAQLMHVQATNIVIGIGSAVVSAILAVGSAIVAAIRRAYELSA